jgi:parallel beta helix pectate lyase-like protein
LYVGRGLVCYTPAMLRGGGAWLVAAAATVLLVSVSDALPAGGSSLLPSPVPVPKKRGPVVDVSCGTLQRALDRLRARQTVVVHGGPCAGQFNVVGRTLESPAEIRSEPGRRVAFTGGSRTGYPAIFVNRSSNVVLGRGIEVVNANGPCIQVEQSRSVRILGARIHDCAGQGILVQSGDDGARSENIQIDRNEIWNVGSAAGGLDSSVTGSGQRGPSEGYWRYGTHAIYFGGGRGVTAGGGVWNNYVHDQPTGFGIQVGGGAQESVIAANTIRRVTRDPRLDVPPSSAGRAGACITVFSSFAGSRNVQVVNNVCTDAATRGIIGSCSCSQGIVWRNVVWRYGLEPAVDPGAFSVGVNWVLDPQLREDGRPLPGSPLVGRAAPRYLPRVDFDGRVRRTRTIGAFEANAAVR